MKLLLSKRSSKFLNSINEPDKSLVYGKIKALFEALKTHDLAQLNTFNIKNLKGNWKGYQRLRVSNIRIIFKFSDNILVIEEVNFRGNLY